VIWFFRLLLLGFAVFGIFIVTKGIAFRRLTPALLSTWTPATGVVVDVLRRNDLGDSPMFGPSYFHKLEYVDPAEQRHEVWTETKLRHALPLGTVLPLRFDPNDPGRATTLTPEEGGGTLPGCVILAGGGVFAVIGIYGLVLTFV